jgi:hypothetical protein
VEQQLRGGLFAERASLLTRVDTLLPNEASLQRLASAALSGISADCEINQA